MREEGPGMDWSGLEQWIRAACWAVLSTGLGRPHVTKRTAKAEPGVGFPCEKLSPTIWRQQNI